MTRFLVALGCLVSLPGLLAAQADSAGPGLRPHFGEPPLTLEQPALLRAPWFGVPRSAAILRTQLFDSTLTATLDSARRSRAVGLRLLTLYGARFDAGEPESPEARRGVLGVSTKYADIALDGQVRAEIRTDRLRNERCSPALLLDPNSGCRGGFKAPRIDNHVDVRSTGIIGRRMHLNIDYQNDRDFSANNDIRVYYEGLEDEIVRRIDVGTVVFQPPPSRFITAAVPSNNFGVNATFEIGPVQLQTLAATQKGSEVAERVYTVGQTTSQTEQRQARDLDFESGRFFWVIDPATLSGYPALDILKLNPGSLNPASRPTQVRVYRYRSATSRTGLNPNLGGITATASRSDSPQRFGPVQWELLIQGSDYYLDPSGLWFSLGTKLDPNDYLAVSYRTAAGTVVGTFPEADQGPNSTDQLILITEPKQSPTVPTFRYEMRQVYRVAGEDLDPASLGVVITVNRSERPLSGAAETYLQLLGLALPNDVNTFDRDNRLFPRSRDPGASQVVHDSYIVFPHLTPFADASRLSPQEISDSLYRTPLFLLSQQGPSARFSLQLQYNTAGGGDRSTLNLDALQIREGSEQLYLGGRRLERGVDYNIAYDLGTVTFLNPDALFGQSSSQVTARFERQGVFAVAPTTILGLSTRYSLGERGAINLIGLYQRESSAFNRPALGFEASANLIGGVNTELHFKPQFLTRLLNGLTSSAASAPSTLDLNAEFALSKPDVNRSGQAYLEEFEADAGAQISLQEGAWEFGSRPQQANGLEDIGFAGGFDPADAVALTWQNLVVVGGQALRVKPQDIDTLIRLAGQGEQEETVMYLTLHADTAGGMVQQNNASRWTLPPRPGSPRWRSMVTSLSPTGIDLTQDEFLEFWARQPAGDSASIAGLRLVFDLGTVSEDALAVAPDSFAANGSDTVFTGRQYIGAGRLDTERSASGIFNAGVDDIGILGDRPDNIVEVGQGPIGELPLCQRLLQNSVPVFPWGDLSSRCTRGNGVLDTEDLNGDGVLDAAGGSESVFRYIVDLAADSFFVRNGVTVGTGAQATTWKLYRIPLRSVAQTLGTPTVRLVQHLRVTLATPPDPGAPDVVARIALARMRFVGSTWTRRSETPILGLSGAVGQPHGAVSTSIVTTENKSDLGYESPPGITDDVARRGGDREAQGTQINEKSLRVRATDLGVNERAEAYLRFPSGPKNLLAYRDLRVWFRGRGPGWEEGDLQAFIKVGSDNDNFYLYRTSAKTTTWEPEVIVQLETWRQLRATIENAWLRGDPPSGAAACGVEDVGAYVACDGPYLVQVLSPGVNPPNLAAVQELSAGIFRVAAAVTVSEAELWVDDIRMAEPLSNTGTARSIDARLAASDVANFSASYISQNGQFRQLNQDPTYKTTDALQLNGALRLERFLPTSLGLSVPLTATYARTTVDPELLTGSDLRGSALPGLRKPDSWSATYSIAIRRNRPGTKWLSKAFFDPLSFTGNLTQGRNTTELSEATANAYSVNLNYLLQMKRRGFRLPLGGLVKGLPKWMREGQLGKGLEKADVSLVPSRVRLGSGLSRNKANSTAFRVPIGRDDDAFIRPATSLTHLWQNIAGLTWQPLGMLSLNGDLTSTRDLRVYPDSSPIGRLAYSERRFFLGVPVGVERDRTLTTALALTPAIASWLRPRFLSSSNFVLSRTLSSRPPVREGEDSGAFILPQTLNNTRTNELGAGVDFGRMLRQVFGDSSGIARALGKIRPLDLSTRLTRASTYDLSAFDPSVGYQLAFGGLDQFLSREGENAIGASESRTATIAGGADLPFGISITLSHALTRTTRLQQVGDGFVQTEIHQQEWPVGNLRWSQIFRGGPLAQVSVGTTVRRREGSSVQENLAGAPALTATRSLAINPDLQVGFRNGIQLAMGLTSLSQRNASNGNETLLDQDDLTGSLNYSFRLPRSLSRQRKQARSSFSVISANTRTCLQQRTETDCTVISDVERKEFRAGLDTDLLQMLSAGLQAGYTINDAKHLSRRTSQISVIASFQLSLFAGDYKQEQ